MLFTFIIIIFVVVTFPLGIKNYYIPFDIRQGLSAVLFIYAGHMLKTHWDSLKKLSNKWIAPIIVVLLILLCVSRQPIDIASTTYPDGLTTAACSVLIASFIICKSKLIDCKSLNYLGKHTLLIYSLHTIFIGFSYILAKTFLELVLINIIPTLAVTYIFVEAKKYLGKWIQAQ